MERRRKRDVVRGVGLGGKTNPRCFQRWVRDCGGYPARLCPIHAQPAQSVLTMLQRIAITRVMRTCGNGKIEPAELKRKYNDQCQGNCPCGYRSSCPTTHTQGALPALKTNSQRPVIQGLSPPIAALNLQDSFRGVKQLELIQRMRFRKRAGSGTESEITGQDRRRMGIGRYRTRGAKVNPDLTRGPG